MKSVLLTLNINYPRGGSESCCSLRLLQVCQPLWFYRGHEASFLKTSVPIGMSDAKFLTFKISGVFLAYNGENLKTWLGPADLKRKKNKTEGKRKQLKGGFLRISRI